MAANRRSAPRCRGDPLVSYHRKQLQFLVALRPGCGRVNKKGLALLVLVKQLALHRDDSHLGMLQSFLIGVDTVHVVARP